MNTEDWRDLALCAQVGLDMFFPEKGESSKAAKWICGRCEVTLDCLKDALENDTRHGVWGGLSEFDRRKLRRGIPPTELPATTREAS